MARDWTNTRATREDILARMEKFGPNVADIPFSEYQERRGSACIWVVQLHVKVRGVTEFDVEGEGDTLAEALRRAYLGLNDETRILSTASIGNLAFGVAV